MPGQGTMSAFAALMHGNPFAMEGLATLDLLQPGGRPAAFFYCWPAHCGGMLALTALVLLLCVLLVRRVALREMTGDTGPVEAGAVATLGLDYSKLGVQTGEMAIRILQDGEDPATMPVEVQTEFDLVVNPKGAEAVGLEIPQDLLDQAAQVIE